MVVVVVVVVVDNTAHFPAHLYTHRPSAWVVADCTYYNAVSHASHAVLVAVEQSTQHSMEYMVVLDSLDVKGHAIAQYFCEDRNLIRAKQCCSMGGGLVCGGGER